MYKVVNKKFKNWYEDALGEPLVFLEDEYGVQSVIAEDDHCFVLFNGSDDIGFAPVKHWYKEAALDLRDLLNKAGG